MLVFINATRLICFSVVKTVTCDMSVVLFGNSGFLHDITEILLKVALNTIHLKRSENYAHNYRKYYHISVGSGHAHNYRKYYHISAGSGQIIAIRENHSATNCYFMKCARSCIPILVSISF
jgi:hypothetical protein